ncbi:MAG: phage tail protein [Chloroflexi bacterium]|nr:phage tail protein [Chloroflexota bacterium]
MIGRRSEIYAAYRFVVQIDGVPEAYFTECTLPTLEVEVEEEKEGGYNTGTHLLPGRVRRGSLTLKRGLARSSALLAWYLSVMQGQITKAQRQVSVMLLDENGAPILRWDLQNAYPTKWTGPTLNTSRSDAAIETLELAFESVVVT